MKHWYVFGRQRYTRRFISSGITRSRSVAYYVLALSQSHFGSVTFWKEWPLPEYTSQQPCTFYHSAYLSSWNTLTWCVGARGRIHFRIFRRLCGTRRFVVELAKTTMKTTWSVQVFDSKNTSWCVVRWACIIEEVIHHEYRYLYKILAPAG